MPLFLVILSAAIAVMAIFFGVRRVYGTFRREQAAAILSVVMAGLFPIWVWPVSIAVTLFSGAMTGTCVPDAPRPHGVVLFVLGPSIAWMLILAKLFGRTFMMLSPLVGAACSLAIYSLTFGSSRSLSDEVFMTFGWMTLAWIIPQVGLGVLLLKPRPGPGHCSQCNYSRAGLPRGAVCPECGSQPA